MIDQLLQIIAPHYCYGCGLAGPLLCSNCKYNIIADGFSACIACELAATNGICTKCRTSYSRAWCVGERTDALEQLIDAFKFERVRGAHRPLAELLDRTVPILPSTTVVVPIPTVRAHIRQRGYDQTRLVAKNFAKRRQLPHQQVLERASRTKQRGASRKQRFDQAKAAFKVNKPLSSETTYLLVDDVVTTNATLRYGAEALKKAGAGDVWVAILARQPLDKAR